MGKLILALFCLAASALADEVYEDSSNICQRCICTGDDEFILDCSDKNFKNVPADWPPHNKTLVATFSNNNITTLKILPYSDQKMKVVFDHCDIKYLYPGVFAAVKNVEFIDLSYNFLTTEEIDGEDFKGPYNNSVYYPIAVRYLNLAYNQIHSLPRNFFENMPDMEELNLEGNDFSVLDQNTQMALSSLTKLKALNLARNELTELVGDAVKNLHSLVEINLAGNMLDFVPETLNYVGSHLEVLILSENYIFQLKDDSFLGLSGIKDLYLDNLPRMEVIHVDAFSSLPNLKKLSLRNNINLKAIDREAFAVNQTLQELYLTNNSLTELDYTLLKWSNLKLFEMGDNQLECDCNLYNISKDLVGDITRVLDGPVCLDPRTGESRQVYSLDEEICGVVYKPFGIHHAIRHFETIRIVVISLSAIFTISAFLAVIISFLRYRKGLAYRNYTFTTQVQYNPIHNQYRI